MRALLVAPYYIHWHYSKALEGIVTITGNCVWFLWHFFSVGLMFQTLFAPWQRIHEVTERKFDIEAFLSTMLINLIMRFVGFVIRLMFIAIGLATMLLTVAGGMVVFLVWLVLPLAVVVGMIFGFILMFKAS